MELNIFLMINFKILIKMLIFFSLFDIYYIIYYLIIKIDFMNFRILWAIFYTSF